MQKLNRRDLLISLGSSGILAWQVRTEAERNPYSPRPLARSPRNKPKVPIGLTPVKCGVISLRGSPAFPCASCCEW